MSQHYERRLRRVIDHIHDHPTGDLSLDVLADVAAMSRFHFHRIWRAMTGETAAQTVRRMRMHRAAVDLVTTTRPLAEIAPAVGYPDVTSFARAFAELYGTPPAAFRRAGALRPAFILTQPTQTQPKGKDMDVAIRTEPARRLAAIPHRGSYHEIGRAFETLFATLSARGMLAGSDPVMIGVYYDDPQSVPAADLKSHAGIAVAEDAVIEAPLEEVRLTGGRYAVSLHKGPYAELPAAWDALYSGWLRTSSEVPANAPGIEIYLNTPMAVAQAELLTELCVPLA